MKKITDFLTGRTGYFLGFILCFGIVGIGLLIQNKYNLEPCPLCISQRIAFMITGLLFLVAAIHNPLQLGRRIYGGLHVAGSIVGIGIAIRHIWIQANPESVMASCGAGFDYMLSNFPFQKFVEMVFKGSGECTKIDWAMLSLTIPQWSLICFACLLAYSIYLAFLSKKI